MPGLQSNWPVLKIVDLKTFDSEDGSNYSRSNNNNSCSNNNSSSMRMRPLPLPNLTSPSRVETVLRACRSPRAHLWLHLLWAAVYGLAGLTQVAAGVHFMLHLPIFQLGSNIWTGAWNVFSCVVTLCVCLSACRSSSRRRCSSSSSSSSSNSIDLGVLRLQSLLLMSLVVLVVNLSHLAILELGEWRGFLSEQDREFVRQNGLQQQMHTAYVLTTASTAAALIASFLAGQQTFIFLQIRRDDEPDVANSTKDGNNNNNNAIGQYDDDELMSTDFVRRDEGFYAKGTNVGGDLLNLKTPHKQQHAKKPLQQQQQQQQQQHHQLQPHPSWVYRNNTAQYAKFDGDDVSSPVNDDDAAGRGIGRIIRRSLSFLRQQQQQQGLAQDHQQVFLDQRRIDLLAHQVGSGRTIRKMTITGFQESLFDHSAPIPGDPAFLAPTAATAGAAAAVHHGNGVGVGGKSTRGMRHAVIRRHQSMYIHPREANNVAGGGGSTRPVVRLYRLQDVRGGVANEIRPIVTLQRSKTTAASLHYRSTAIPNGSSGSIPRTTFSNGSGGGSRLTSSLKKQQHLDQLCEFQAGKSFDLPLPAPPPPPPAIQDPNGVRLRRYMQNWSGGNAQQQVGKGRQQQQYFKQQQQQQQWQNFDEQMESLDSCHGNLRYQAVEAMRIQTAAPAGNGVLKNASSSQGHYSSVEDLLDASGRAVKSNRSRTSTRSHFGSTESLDSLGQNDGHGNKKTSTTQTAAAPAVRRNVVRNRVQKSDSRVASAGRLRLRVESFRQQQQQGDKGKKSGVTPPSKPVRKSKVQQQHQDRDAAAAANRAERSESPPLSNSSTSGYSSPSAGNAHSKESSPYGSKIGQHDELDEEEVAGSSKVTVIQIVPATTAPSPGKDDESRGAARRPEENGSSVDDDEEEEEDEELPESAVQQQQQQQRQRQHEINLRRFQQLERRLLLSQQQQQQRDRSSSPPHQQQQQPHRELPKMPNVRRRQLPEADARAKPSQLLQQYLNRSSNNSNSGGNATKPFLAPRGPVGRKIFRSSAPSSHRDVNPPSGGGRPFVPARTFGPSAPPPPSASSQFLLLPHHVPLPPVPELDRSDQERESVSPSPAPNDVTRRQLPPTESPPPPPSNPQALSNGYEVPTLPRSSSSAPQPAIRRLQPPQDQHYQRPSSSSSSRLPATPVRRADQLAEEESRLRALMALVRRQNEGNGDGGGDGGGEEDADSALQYLSQLEATARRLKDQLMREQARTDQQQPKVHRATLGLEGGCSEEESAC